MSCPTPEKKAHATKADATAHARALRKYKHGAPDLLPYLCACGVWHIGHSRVHLNKRIRRALYSTEAHQKRRGSK